MIVPKGKFKNTRRHECHTKVVKPFNCINHGWYRNARFVLAEWYFEEALGWRWTYTKGFTTKINQPTIGGQKTDQSQPKQMIESSTSKSTRFTSHQFSLKTSTPNRRLGCHSSCLPDFSARIGAGAGDSNCLKMFATLSLPTCTAGLAAGSARGACLKIELTSSLLTCFASGFG